MKGVLGDFLQDSGFAAEGSIDTGYDGRTKMKKRTACEGIWVRCRGRGADRKEDEATAEGEEDEDDEMIWWTWDGKIIGFSDW